MLGRWPALHDPNDQDDHQDNGEQADSAARQWVGRVVLKAVPPAEQNKQNQNNQNQLHRFDANAFLGLRLWP